MSGGLDLSNPEAVIAESRRRAARRAAGEPLHDDTPALELGRIADDDSREEKEIQREVFRRLRSFGCEVYWLSQARVTRQTAGVPDLIAFHPRLGVMTYFECKTPRGKPSPAQVYFAELCEKTGTSYVIGGVAACEEWLRSIGARADG
jgi:hypothetical protein